MTGKEKERVIPITTDARTLEQRRKDMVNNLERKQKGASGNLAKVDEAQQMAHNDDTSPIYTLQTKRRITNFYTSGWATPLGRSTPSLRTGEAEDLP
ncbi:hypothetical protein EG68_10495 [Paragonimus skrjabini miyazakii]|uniref:Uncharacterized protein n=1 Tax=Paragonimus skrjabini miyazakii TaxID=59628 RepID=A0A8S9YFA3_9TREM|nr:hypothetical protein EG68_10495 [Paragonimus skrjabini miyazakii]